MREAVGQAHLAPAAGRTPFGVNLAVGAAAMVAATAAAALLFPAAGESARLVVVCLAVGGYAALVADTRASLATAALGFLLFDGFLVNRDGELSWDGRTTSWHLVAFVLATGLGLGQRWIRHARADLAVDEELNEIVENIDTRMKESHGG